MMRKIISFFLLFCALIVSAQSPLSKFNVTVSGSNTLSFSNLSTGNPTTFAWEFVGGNPAASTSSNPVVTYATPGSYTAKLTVSNASGSSVSVRTVKVTTGNTIDLSTGRNDDGTLMAISTTDYDWKCELPDGTIVNPFVRSTYGQWSFAQIITNVKNSAWITGNDIGTGDYIYRSKSFTIPNNVSDAKLNLRTLSFVKGWTYLVKENIDGSQTETLITQTSGTGWFNSGNALVSDLHLDPGNYHLKVKVYDNNGSVTEATDVNANVTFGNSNGNLFEFSPIAEFSATPTSGPVGSNVQFTNLSQGTPSSLSWKFDDGANVLTSTNNNPVIAFSVLGNHYAELNADYGNGLLSSLRINNYIEIVTDKDYTKAPNSYIFTGKDKNGSDVDGLYIPVKKAYAMWRDKNGLLNDATVLNGTPTAEVYWEDVSGLIRSTNYSLPLVGDGEYARIKVEIDKAKGKGNAVVALKINSKIIWSWHVWVTDDPTNGVTYGHVSDGKETASYVENGVIKKFTPKWMDRNLGATSKNFIGYDWIKSGGLMYQWGRKDPFPAFQNKDASNYEIRGTVGIKKHINDYTSDGAANEITFIQRPFNDINNNIKYAVNNPLNLILKTNDAWFAQNVGTDNVSRKKSDLWGDNSQNATTTTGSAVNPYQPKTAYDPCPNSWRIPSFINNNHSGGVSNSFSPWGRGGGSPSSDEANYNYIWPMSENGALIGIKIYANLGMDFTNTFAANVPRNLGVYPGNGKYAAKGADFYHQDPHEIGVHSATMATDGATSYFFSAYGDAGQFDTNFTASNNPSYPNMVGKYFLHAYMDGVLSDAVACRCIEDKYAKAYNFPTEYFNSDTLINYTEGINNPNTYVITKTATEQEIQIPVSKAFSVYNQYLSDHGMLDFNNLKVNVYWTDNKSLISNIRVINAPTNLNNIKDGYISVKVPGNQSGNALISLHSGNVSNPAYWSWHVWVSNSNINELVYQTEDVLLPATSNYVNFTNSGAQPIKNTFMDRNLGATDAFPDVVNPESATQAEVAMINNSAGMQYQWGRKDPIPTFIKVGLDTTENLAKTGDFSIWTSSGPDANGNIYPSSYTELNGSAYISNYTKRRDIDYGTTGTTNTEKIKNNLKYSVENPLAFMVPNQKYTNRSAVKDKYGQDWLVATPNQMMERWGHATIKSPFDPCPGGWRVPDISNKVVDNVAADKDHVNSNKGSSPWYNGFYMPTSSTDKFRIHNLGIVQDLDYEIKNPSDIYNGGIPYYLGSVVKKSNIVLGYQFNFPTDSGNPNTKFKIGNFPATGFRGYNGSSYTNPLSSAMNLGFSGVWTAALRSNNSYGSGYNMSFETFNINSSKLRSLTDEKTNHPMNAMNVRCVKEQSSFGQPLGVASNMGRMATIVSNKKGIANNILNEEKEDIEIYPNPVKNLLYVKSNTAMMYEIYDTGGRLISKGETLNGRIDCSSLVKGLYILKLYGTNTMITKKIVKK